MKKRTEKNIMEPVPTQRTLQVGNEQIGEIIDKFLRERAEHAETEEGVSRRTLEVKTGEISYREGVITNDRITYLTDGDRILAGVLETRTEFNHERYTFFRDIDD